MRFHSTPQTALKGEITILALIETVVSVAIYVGIGLYFGTFKYLAWAIVVAPLMLFRTEVSSNWGLKFYEQCLKELLQQDRIDRFRQLSGRLSIVFGIVFLVVVALGVPIIGVTIRIIATLYWAIRKPLRTLSDMPQNWMRQSFCTDFFHPPEILPLEAVNADRGKTPTMHRVLNILRKNYKNWALLFILFSTLVIGYVPSVIYRITFKATAIAYLPFIWVAHATLRNPLLAKLRLERFTKGELEKVRRVISLFIVTILAAKVGLVWGGWLEQSFIEAKFPSKRLAESLVAFGSWPWWQMTLAADALLTFFLFFFADAALGRIDSPQAWKEERTLGTVSAISFLRAVLALATISHFFYIALRAVAPKSLLHLLAT